MGSDILNGIQIKVTTFVFFCLSVSVCTILSSDLNISIYFGKLIKGFFRSES